MERRLKRGRGLRPRFVFRAVSCSHIRTIRWSFVPRRTLQEAVALAIEHQRAGRYAQAVEIWREVVVVEPGNGRVLRLFGDGASGAQLAAQQRGRTGRG